MRLGAGAHILLAASIVCALAARVPSGQSGPSSQSAVTLRTTTTLIQVNVVAHDRTGRVIDDLKKDEFEILDSGKPQTIAVFIPEKVAGIPPPPGPPSAPGRFTNRISADPARQRGYALILLDYLNTGFRNTARARQSAINALNKLEAGTAVGLYTLDRYGVHVRSELGSDRAAVLKAINSAMGTAAPCHQASLDGLGDDDMLDCVNSGSSPLRRFTEFATVNRITDTLNDFEAIAGHLKDLPGRKALIWVSAAYPLQVDMRAPAQDLFPEAMGSQQFFTSEVGRAMKALNNADVALYPVDSRALSSESSVGSAADFTWPTMDFFAERTGGKAFYGRNDMDAGMLSAAEDVLVSYTLGFYVTNTGDPGGFHKLSVKTTRPGVELRYKEGFYTEAPKPQKKDARRQAVGRALTGLMDARDIPIDAAAVRARDVIRVQISLKPDTLALEYKNGRWKGTVELVTRFARLDGSEAGTGSIRRLDLNLTQATYDSGLKDGLGFTRTLTVPKDAQRLRILVRNDLSGEMGTLTIPLAEVK